MRKTIDSLAKPNKYPIIFFVFTLTLSIAANGLSSLILDTLGTWLETKYGLSKIFWQIVVVSILSIILFLSISNIKRIITNIFGDRSLISEAPEELSATFSGLIIFASLKVDSAAKIAIQHHWKNSQGDLKHCWIISGGQDALITTKEMIKSMDIPESIFHFDSKYNMRDPENPKNPLKLILKSEDANDPNQIRKIVEAIYQDAKENYDLYDSDIIADYTGGTKSMTAGLVLACASPDRRLQYVLSDYIDNKPVNPKVMEIKLSYSLKPVKTY
jgi:hypothetical protein